MGRRSINTTKSGKFMNPTDQARKEARKKELKKNKKQRLLVRTAVLKNKDPGLIIQELDKLDEVEFNPVEAPALADKVLKDKRKKLKETLDRVMRLYQKEDPTMWNELRQIEADYERRRFHRVQYFEAVKQAESLVNIEEIPLPIEEQPSVSDIPLPDMPMPPPPSSSGSDYQPTSILKHSGSSGSSSHRLLIDTESPGVPVGSPPDLSSGEEDEDDEEGNADERMETNATTTTSNNNNTTTTTTTTSDKRNEDSSKRDRSNSKSDKGTKKSVHFDDLDEFMKEIEEEFKTNEEELQPPGMEKKSKDSQQQQQQQQKQQAPVDTNKSVPLPPPSMPPVPPPNRIQFYGQPPPQLAPPFPAPPNRPRIPAPPPAAYRIPPPPRPVFPPNFQRPQRFRTTTGNANAASGTGSVFSSGPQINPSQQREVISAKPQLRSLSADVTRFIPVAVKTKANQNKDDIGFSKTQQQQPQKPAAPIPQPGPSKDDAYADFMKEMQGLL